MGSAARRIDAGLVLPQHRRGAGCGVEPDDLFGARKALGNAHRGQRLPRRIARTRLHGRRAERSKREPRGRRIAGEEEWQAGGRAGGRCGTLTRPLHHEGCLAPLSETDSLPQFCPAAVFRGSHRAQRLFGARGRPAAALFEVPPCLLAWLVPRRRHKMPVMLKSSRTRTGAIARLHFRWRRRRRCMLTAALGAHRQLHLPSVIKQHSAAASAKLLAPPAQLPPCPTRSSRAAVPHAASPCCRALVPGVQIMQQWHGGVKPPLARKSLPQAARDAAHDTLRNAGRRAKVNFCAHRESSSYCAV